MNKLGRLELETIVKDIPAAVLVIEKATGKITYGNDGASFLFGISLEGLTIPSDTEKVIKVFNLNGSRYPFDKLPVRQALAKGEEVEDEFIIERPDGSRVIVRGLAKPVKDEHGSITAAVGIFEDITQRKIYEESLRASEERFRLVAEAAKVLVYELDPATGGVVILRGEDVLGYQSGEIPREEQWWLSQIHSEDKKHTEESLRKAIATGTDYFLEYRIKCKSGNYIVAHDTGKAVFDESGKGTKFVGGMRDVTERKKAEQDLKTNESRFRSVYEDSLDAIMLTIPDGTILSANPSAQRMFGMTEEEIKKLGRSGLIVQDQRLINALKERERKGSAHAQLTFKRKDGTTFEGEITSSLFTDKDGTTKTSMIIRDITERKKAEASIKESEQRYHSLFSNLMDGFAYCQVIFNEQGDPIDFVYLEINNAFERLTGLTREQVVGRKVSEAIPETKATNPELFEIYGRVAQTCNEERFEIFFKPLRKWFDISVYCPKIGYFVAVFEEITEEKEVHATLEAYSKDLERLVEERTKQLKDKERLAAIGETAGMVGHDIRNPLQAIVGDLYIAREATKGMPNSEEKQSMEETLGCIEDNIFYINKIVSDLQDYTRPLRPQLEEVNLFYLVKNAVGAACVPNNIITAVNIDANLLVKVDVSFLKRVLTNLAINAVQAMPDGGKLTIKAFPTNGKIFINVEDTGVGIPESVKAKLFTPLFTTKSKGQGLGLAVVKRLVEGLNGTISLESEEGKGTKFIIQLPM